jgi:hypothetical protein
MAGLLGETLRAAAARGLDVTVQLIGAPPVPPPAAATAVQATVAAVLDELPPHPAVLTVLAGADEVELYLSFGLPPRTRPALAGFGASLPASLRWRAELTEDCLEIGWHPGGAG